MTRTDVEFIQKGFQKVEGWCTDEAAYITCCLLACQADAGYGGGVLEIGVWKGKYLSVLYHGVRASKQPAVGVDVFQTSSPDGVVAAFTEVFGSTSGLTLITADSRTLSPSQILSYFGGRKPSFISVDGDHTAAAVCADIAFAKSILAEGGIIAVDDFLNPSAIGVSEGTYRFFIETHEERLLPFTFSSNKLFIAEASYHELYRNALILFASQMPEIPMNREFNRLLQTSRSAVDQPLLGSQVLILRRLEE